MDELTSLKKQVSELNDENLQLRGDVAYLKGKVEAYEWFLQTKGYIQGGEIFDTEVTDGQVQGGDD